MIDALVLVQDTAEMRADKQFAFDVLCVGFQLSDGGIWNREEVKIFQLVQILDDELQQKLVDEFSRNPKHPPKLDAPYRITVIDPEPIQLQSDRQIRIDEMSDEDWDKIRNRNIQFRRIMATEVRTTMSRT